MSENPPRKGTGKENPPVDPEITEQVRAMREKARELHFSLLEQMKEKGLSSDQLGDLWDQAVLLNKTLIDTAGKYKNTKDPAQREAHLAHFEEAKKNLEFRVVPEILNTERRSSEQVQDNPEAKVESAAPERKETVVQGSWSEAFEALRDSDGLVGKENAAIIRKILDNQQAQLAGLSGKISKTEEKSIGRALGRMEKSLGVGGMMLSDTMRSLIADVIRAQSSVAEFNPPLRAVEPEPAPEPETQGVISRAEGNRIKDVARRAERVDTPAADRERSTSSEEVIEGKVIRPEAVPEITESEPQATPAEEIPVAVEPEALPLSALEQPLHEEDLTPKESAIRAKGPLKDLLGKKTKKRRVVPQASAEAGSEITAAPEVPASSFDDKDPAQLQAHIRSLAHEVRGEDAAQVFAQRGGGLTGTSTEIYKEHGASMVAMLEAEKDYLTAYKAEKKKQGFVKTALNKYVDADMFLSRETKDKKEAWQKSRVGYLTSMNASLDARLDRNENRIKGAREKNDIDSRGYDRDAIMARYEQRYGARMLNAAVMGAEKAEVDARVEGLSQRDKKTFEKLVDNYQKLPAYVRIPATFGLIAAATAGATALSGGALVGLGALAVTGTVTGVRAGLATLIERTKDAGLKQVLGNVAMLTSMGGIGAWIGKKSANLYDAARGTEKEAEKILSKEHSIRDFTDASRANRTFEKRASALTAKEDMKRHEAIGSAIGATAAAVTGGFGIGSFFKGIFGGGHHDVAPVDHKSPLEQEYENDGQAHHPLDQRYHAPAEQGHVFTESPPFRQSSMGYQPFTADELKHEMHITHPTEHHDAAPSPETHHTTPAHEGHRTHLEHSSRADSGHHAEADTRPIFHPTDEDRARFDAWRAANPDKLPPHADMHTVEILQRLRVDNGPDALKDMNFETTHTPEPIAAPEPAMPETAPEEVPRPEAASPEETPQPEASESVPTEAPVQHEEPSTVAPTHEQAPAPEAPTVHHEVAPAPEVPPTPQTHEDSAPTDTTSHTETTPETTAMNTHGLLIDRQAPHIYADNKDNYIVHGGTDQQQIDLRKDFLSNPKNFGKPLFMITSTPDPLTGKPDVIAWVTDMRGRIEYKGILADDNNIPYAPPTENDFIKKVF